jgi:hypothetical protein
LGENTIVSSGAQLIPWGDVASQSTTGSPPPTEIFFNFPEAKKPTHCPSGEKKALDAPSVPEVKAVVQAAGYRGAVTTRFGVEGLTPADPFAIARLAVHEGKDLGVDRWREGDRQEPVLQRVLTEDVGEGGRHHRAKAEIEQRPGRVLARAPAAEVASRHQDPGPARGRQVERARAPAREEVRPEAFPRGGLQEASRAARCASR